MKTPKEYMDNLNNHIITTQMLVDSLYSSNKRAKNWRDKERGYREKSRYNRNWTDRYHSEEKARDEKEKYYHQKDTMLSILKPVCIHRETVERSHKERIYDFEDEYWEYEETGEFFHTGSYWDKELQDYVNFGDVYVDDDPVIHYYLFYDVGANHTFHTPISEEDVCLYGNLEVKDIDQLYTAGDDVSDLLSNQFVTKLLNLIHSDDYKLVENI